MNFPPLGLPTKLRIITERLLLIGQLTSVSLGFDQCTFDDLRFLRVFAIPDVVELALLEVVVGDPAVGSGFEPLELDRFEGLVFVIWLKLLVFWLAGKLVVRLGLAKEGSLI